LFFSTNSTDYRELIQFHSMAKVLRQDKNLKKENSFCSPPRPKTVIYRVRKEVESYPNQFFFSGGGRLFGSNMSKVTLI